MWSRMFDLISKIQQYGITFWSVQWIWCLLLFSITCTLCFGDLQIVSIGLKESDVASYVKLFELTSTAVNPVTSSTWFETT